jgi:hypothetical protein
MSLALFLKDRRHRGPGRFWGVGGELGGLRAGIAVTFASGFGAVENLPAAEDACEHPRMGLQRQCGQPAVHGRPRIVWPVLLLVIDVCFCVVQIRSGEGPGESPTAHSLL